MRRQILPTSFALIIAVFLTSVYSQQFPKMKHQPRLHSAQPTVTEFAGFQQSHESALRRSAKDQRLAHVLPAAVEDPARYEPEPRTSTVRIIVDYVVEKEALPVSKVSAIAIGDVIDSTAYITPDKTSVYSEFHVRIQDVLKGDAALPIGSESLILTTRRGGAVHFPSGHIRNFLFDDVGFPKVNTKYIFFLWRDPMVTEHDYGIYTAYELTDDKVYALDDGQQFDAYEGVEAASFLRNIRKLINVDAQKGAK